MDPTPGNPSRPAETPESLTREELRRQIREAAEGSFRELSRILRDSRRTIAAQEETIRDLTREIEDLKRRLKDEPRSKPSTSPHEIQEAIDRALRREFGI